MVSWPSSGATQRNPRKVLVSRARLGEVGHGPMASSGTTEHLFTWHSTSSLAPSVAQFLCAKYAGCLGVGSVVASFSNMNTIDDMSGLAFGSS